MVEHKIYIAGLSARVYVLRESKAVLQNVTQAAFSPNRDALNPKP